MEKKREPIEFEKILESKSCRIGINEKTRETIISFNGELIDTKEGNIINDNAQYTITFPLEVMKKIVMGLISVGVEYQLEKKEDIGFGQGDDEDE